MPSETLTIILMASNTSTPFNQISNIGLIAGPLVALSILLIGAPSDMIAESTSRLPDAWITLSLLTLMAIWWVTEAVPIPV